VSRTYISAALRAAVAEQARYRCGYCLTAAAVIGMSMDVEHIIPQALNGATIEACS
jgi:5-methylcytosine-specific restriction endonuclease McrA